jgi:hypothetical protein
MHLQMVKRYYLLTLVTICSIITKKDKLINKKANVFNKLDINTTMKDSLRLAAGVSIFPSLFAIMGPDTFPGSKYTKCKDQSRP